jgi:hypothetical protein
MSTSASTFTIEKIKEYNADQLVDYLRKNLKNLTEDDLRSLREQKVSGLAFLRLTEQKLLKDPYGLLGGPASEIAWLIEQQLKIEGRFYHKIV